MKRTKADATTPRVQVQVLGTATQQLPSATLAEAAAIEEQTASYASRARAANTRRAYDADWAHFTTWCNRFRAESLPADPRIVARYLSAFAEQLKVSTLQRRLSAIQHFHRAAGLELDTRHAALRDTWRGIRRVHGTAPTQKVPTITEILRAVLEPIPPSLGGVRDRALLLVGFAGCFRRSELVSIDHADLARHRDGIVIHLRSSKTDQEGEGAEIGIPYGAHPETCPIRALTDWLDATGITEGPVFRPVNRHGRVLPERLTDRSVALIVKRSVQAARDVALTQGNVALSEYLDPKRFAGHSLRAGFITSAAAAGVGESDIMRQSRHTRGDTLRKYIRHATVFRQNAASKVGL